MYAQNRKIAALILFICGASMYVYVINTVVESTFIPKTFAQMFVTSVAQLINLAWLGSWLGMLIKMFLNKQGTGFHTATIALFLILFFFEVATLPLRVEVLSVQQPEATHVVTIIFIYFIVISAAADACMITARTRQKNPEVSPEYKQNT